MPGETAMVCEEVVLPFPQRNANGATPSEAEAVHVMFDAVGEPTHEVVNAEAELAKTNESMNATLAIEAQKLFRITIISTLIVL